MRARTAAAATAVLAVLGAVTGCDQAPAQVPPTVIVNTPPAEGGSMVLVTVLIGVAFLAAAGAVVCAWGWCSERRSRREAETARRRAEDLVCALTGHPVGPVPGLLARQDGGWSSVLQLRAGVAGDAPDSPAGGSGATR